MKFLKYLVFTLVITTLSTALLAQEPLETQTINDGSVADQFEFAIKKSNNYNDGQGRSYEVIRRTMMLNLKKNAVDSVNAIKNRLSSATDLIATQKNEINTLKADLGKTQETLTDTNKEKDSMQLLGMQMSKTGYNSLMWAIIAGLLGLLLFFIFKFKNSNVITRETKNSFSELENEFKEHRRVALEREQKVKRELQDLINKHGL